MYIAGQVVDIFLRIGQNRVKDSYYLIPLSEWVKIKTTIYQTNTG